MFQKIVKVAIPHEFYYNEEEMLYFKRLNQLVSKINLKGVNMISTLSNIIFVIGFSFIILFLYSLSKHRNRVSGLFSLMCLTIAIYLIGYGFELRSENIEQIIFFLKMEYFGTSFMTTIWFLFSYKFYFNKNPSLRLKIIVMVIPILTLFFNVTNEYHHLFYTNISAVQHNGFLIVHLSRGPWYFVNIVYSYVVLLLGSTFFYRVWKNSLYTMRTQALLMFIGTLCPGMMNFVYLLGLSPYGLDLVPFGLSILAILYFIALFRYDFFDIGDIIRSVVFAEIREGIIVVDDKKRLIDFNNAAQKVFSCLKVVNIGINLSDVEELREIVEYESSPFEIEMVHNGCIQYYEVRVTDLTEKNKIVGSVFFIRDITKQREMIQKLETMASYDDLTQVYNRRRLMEEAKKAALRVMRHKSFLSVLMIDIDFFKNINDKYGHLAGDEVIKTVIRSCEERLRSTDIIGRYGGEEFIIILPEANLKNSLRIAEHIRKHVEDMEVTYDGAVIKVTISIGVASNESNAETINVMKVIDDADLALYNAKNSGRNRVSS